MADLPKKFFTPKSYNERFPRYGRGTVLLSYWSKKHQSRLSIMELSENVVIPKKNEFPRLG